MAMLPAAPALPPPDEDLEEGEGEDETQGMLAIPVIGKSRAETLDTRGHDVIKMSLEKMSQVKLPPVHDYPAPQITPSMGDPTLPHARAPSSATVGLRQSYFARFLNSTLGRFGIFSATLLCVNISIMGLGSWNSPENRLAGSQYMIFVISSMIFAVTFTMPLLAERSGMSALDTGWKPFLVCYRIALVTAIPACVLQLLGSGSEVEFGTAAGAIGEVKLKDLEDKYWDYFELADGFVALNLTYGVTETLVPEEHGVKDHKRISRFRDAELQINTEPYSDEVEPTETPGALTTYRVAPVFADWAPCLARYRMSTGCLSSNPILAWAVAKSDTLCSRQRSVGCKPPKPKLEPVYQCSKKLSGGNTTYGIRGVGRTEAISGICGHVTVAPPKGAIDELGALLLWNAWPKISLPNSTTIWLDISPSECLNDTAKCKANWSNLYLGGLVFQILTNLLVLIPMWLDCKVDGRIREARKFVEQEESKHRAELIARASGFKPGT